MDIFVKQINNHFARLTHGDYSAACVLGAAGLAAAKYEGDSATPRGRYRLRRLWYRSDREARPVSPLPIRAIGANDGWVDCPKSANYNRHIILPRWKKYPHSYEHLWRSDHLYNLFFEIGYNDNPPAGNLGSAIFLHLAPQNNQPTRGCIGVSRTTMSELILRVNTDSFITIN